MPQPRLSLRNYQKRDYKKLIESDSDSYEEPPQKRVKEEPKIFSKKKPIKFK